jgi:hypothetical protein
MENRDELYDRLLESTKEILGAAQRVDLEQLGQAIDTRQQWLDHFSGQKPQKMTDEQKVKYNELVILDKKASVVVRELLEQYKTDVKNSNAKYDGLIKYNNSGFDLSSGRVIDKIR